MTESNVLHIGTDRTGRTWRVMDRDDSFSVYYTNDGDPAHHVIYDSLDEWRDPPRVLLGRAEQAERRVKELERELEAARAYIKYTHTAYHADTNQTELWAAWHDAVRQPDSSL